MDPKNQQLRARSRAASEGKPLFIESPAFPGEALRSRGASHLEAKHLGHHLGLWLRYKMKAGPQGSSHFQHHFDQVTMVFKSNKGRPLPAKQPIAFEVFPPPKSKLPPGHSLDFL